MHRQEITQENAVTNATICNIMLTSPVQARNSIPSIVTPKAVTGVPLLGFTFPSILGREPSFPIAYIILEPLIIKPFKVETAAKIPPIAIINAPLEVNVAAAAARGALSLANCA